jgi:hypothetical protein
VATAEVRAAKAAMKSAAMESTTVAAPAVATPAVATPAVATTAMRKSGNWLGQCKNAHQSSCSNTQAAGDTDRFHADLLLSIAARLAAPEE